MPQIVTIGNVKGGVGKTTATLNLGAWLAHIQQRPWLIDADRQGSLTEVMAQRAEAGDRVPSLAAAHYIDGQNLRAQVQLQAGNFTHVLIDAGGRDSTAFRAALALSDMVVIPFQPRSLDLWALQGMNELVAEVRALGRPLKALTFLNMADIQGNDNREAEQALENFPELAFLDAPLMRRKAFANAIGEGLSVIEQAQQDKKAAAELAYLAERLEL
jgi:chromosome partitioning protein